MRWLLSRFPIDFGSCLTDSTAAGKAESCGVGQYRPASESLQSSDASTQREKVARLRSQRRGQDELGAGMARDDRQRCIQLFGERADHTGAHSPPLADL